MFDILIIGGGPGGYVAAERAGARGLKVGLVEKAELGGVCLNRGCIPTKSLLNSAKIYAHAREGARFGVHGEATTFSLTEAMAWKNEVVAKLTSGVASAMKAHHVEVIAGEAEIIRPGLVRVKETGVTLEAASIIIATGSSPAMPPIPGSQGNPLVLDSTGLLSITELPKRLTVIGGGVIGVEFASLFATLGVKVDVIEMLDEIVPFMDRELAPVLRRGLKAVAFKLGCRVVRIEGAAVVYEKDGKEERSEADLVLMAVGRRPTVTGFGAEKIGLDVSPKGIRVDDRMRTNLPGVYAIGDVTGKSLLAHSASRMGEVAVNVISGRQDRMRWNSIPWAVYSIPEAVGVGLTEAEAVAGGLSVRTVKVTMKLSGRFVAENGLAAPGDCKLVTEAASGRILGVHAVGSYASEYIWGAAALIEQEMSVRDVRDLVFPHPTVSEIIREAAWALKE